MSLRAIPTGRESAAILLFTAFFGDCFVCRPVGILAMTVLKQTAEHRNEIIKLRKDGQAERLFSLDNQLLWQ